MKVSRLPPLSEEVVDYIYEAANTAGIQLNKVMVVGVYAQDRTCLIVAQNTNDSGLRALADALNISVQINPDGYLPMSLLIDTPTLNQLSTDLQHRKEL